MSPSENAVRRTYTDRGISFEIPAGWSELDWGVADPLRGIKLRPAEDEASIVIEQSTIEQRGLGEYADGLLASLSAVMPRFHLVQRTADRLQGRETVRFHFAYSEQVPRDNLHVVILDGPRVVSVYLDAAREQLETYRADFERVVGSLDLLGA